MFGITSRYIVREVVLPFCLALFVFTFLMLLPPIMRQGEELIRIGVDGRQVAEMLALLIPQSLAVTIPMALLVGVLMGLGRMSGDRETVAMQACGISLYRILSPLLALALAAAAVNCYLLLSVVPDANQRFRERLLRVQANRAEGEVKPRVFYVGAFPDLVLYVEEVSTAGAGWSNVFLADLQRPERPDIYIAERGRVTVDRDRQSVAIVLGEGERHRVDPADGRDYEVHAFAELRIQIDTESLFSAGLDRGLREMTIPELAEQAAVMQAAGISPHAPIMEAHKKFSIPFACFVFVLLGVGFGASSRTDGRAASFALGIGVIFAYYVLMYQAEALAKGQQVPPHTAMWLPNIVLGLAGVALVLRRARSVARGWSLPPLPRLRRKPARSPAARPRRQAPLVTVSGAAPAGVGILDWYVTKMYLHWVGIAFVGLLGIFYITNFIELSDKLFKEQATGAMLLRYFWYATPQFVYFVLPISGLLAALVTIGLLTRTSELTVMKACGISLYRAAAPILLLSVLWSGALFAIGETVLARANRTAETLNREIRTGRTQTFDVLNRQWLHHDGVIHHYRYFDVDRSTIDGLSVYEFDDDAWSLARRTWAAHATFENAWEGRDVWSREFPTEPAASSFQRTGRRALQAVASPTVFASERTDAELMNFRELERYITDLRARGFDVVDLVVELHRKASFPFITVILTLIAVPFAVTTGARGALYGVGVGIVLAFTYWSVLSVFGALGSAGVLMPATAAWAPNLIFGASAGYFLLTVRT